MRGNSAFKNVHGSLSYSAFNQVITIDGHWVHPDTAQTHTHTFFSLVNRLCCFKINVTAQYWYRNCWIKNKTNTSRLRMGPYIEMQIRPHIHSKKTWFLHKLIHCKNLMTFPYMSFYKLCPTEGHSTDWTRMGLFSCVAHLVSLQNTWGFKVLFTCWTFIRLFTCMHPHVCSEVIRLHKALATFLTLEWPFPCVIAGVYLQLRRWSETLAALAARVRPFLCVGQMVSRQWACASEQFATVGARVAHTSV